MKMHRWVMALVLVSLCTGALAAETPNTSRDQAILDQLAQSACTAPTAAAAPLATGLENVLMPPARPLTCAGTFCTKDTDCYAACPGGLGSSYCDRTQHRCFPF
jgi:hypothetical protein